MTYQIETSIPLPTSGRNSSPEREAMAQLAKAPVGSSILFPKSDSVHQQASLTSKAVNEAGTGWCTVRKVEGGFRAWKIAEPKQPTPLRAAA